MTQRFGRNKRRAARAAVETAMAERNAAMAAVDVANGIAEHAQMRARHARALMEDIADRIIMVLGDDSAILPIELTRGRRDQGPHATRHPIRRDLDSIPLMLDPGSTMMDMLSIDEISTVLHRLVMRVEDDPREFRTLIRFVTEPSEPAVTFSPRYYMISNMALTKIGIGRDLYWLAEEIARGLINLEEVPHDKRPRVRDERKAARL